MMISLLIIGPLTDWRPVHGAPCLSPYDGWNRLQPPCDPELYKWTKMDGIDGWIIRSQLGYIRILSVNGLFIHIQ